MSARPARPLPLPKRAVETGRCIPIAGFECLHRLALGNGFVILTGRLFTHALSSPTRVEREVGKFLSVVSLMSKTLRERASSGSTETVANTEAQPLTGQGDREVIVVGGSAAGLFTAASGARGGRPARLLQSKPHFQPAARAPAVPD